MSQQIRDALEAQLARLCSRPRWVSGKGKMWCVPCGSRLVERCPSCASKYLGDWQAIARSGFYEPGTQFVPAQGSSFLFLTLTAPSFGATHHVRDPKDSPRRCGCGKYHLPNEQRLRGVPVDAETYDYSGQVDWNTSVGRLWNATRVRLRARLPEFEYFGVREWQARGALHLHVLLRFAADAVPAPAVVEAIARNIQSHTDGGMVATWGPNVDCRPVRVDSKLSGTVHYLTKTLGYLTKSVSHAERAEFPELAEHHARLTTAAHAYWCPSCPDKTIYTAAVRSRLSVERVLHDGFADVHTLASYRSQLRDWLNAGKAGPRPRYPETLRAAADVLAEYDELAAKDEEVNTAALLADVLGATLLDVWPGGVEPAVAEMTAMDGRIVRWHDGWPTERIREAQRRGWVHLDRHGKPVRAPERVSEADLRTALDKATAEEVARLHRHDRPRCFAPLHREWGSRAKVVYVSHGWTLTGLTRSSIKQAKRAYVASLPAASLDDRSITERREELRAAIASTYGPLDHESAGLELAMQSVAAAVSPTIPPAPSPQ